MLLMSFISILGSKSSSLLLIYTSKRFDWSFSQANLLTTLRAIVNLIAIMICLPLVGYFLVSQLHMSARQRDIYLARASSLVILAGLVGIGIAQTASLAITGVVLSALGSGIDALLRSFLTSVIAQDELSLFYTAMTLFQILGESASGPLYSSLFSLGLNMEGTWLGLPFLVASGLFVVLATMLCMLRFLGEDDAEGED